MSNVNTPHKETLCSAVLDTTLAYQEKGYFPSAAVTVFTGQDTLCELAVGDATPQTVFDVASLSKIATATQVLLAIDQGRAALSDGILAHLPELAQDDLLRERLADVTLEKLLTHTSAIVEWYPFYAETGDFASVLHTALARYAPVQGMVYSDLNFMLLGKLLEKLSGLPLDQCTVKNLTEPLSLGRLTYRPDPAWDIAPSCYGNPIEEEMCCERGIAFDGWRPHTPVRGEANDGNAYYYFGGAAGSAGVFADIAAYRKLGQFHLATKSPLLIHAQEECAPTRGLGWQVSDMYPDGCGHTGFTGTSIYISRKLDLGVVTFTNRLFFPEKNLNMTNDYRRALHRAVAELFPV